MTALKVIERNGKRVITTIQVANFFETETKIISYNFNYNKDRYQEGVHYIVLKGEERKEFLFNNMEIHDGLKHAKNIYLWTEKGVFLHAKSLGTDKAWEAYSALVDDYFNKVDQLQRMNIPTTIPTTVEDILELAVINMKDIRNELRKVQEENRMLKLVVDNEIILTKHQRSEIQLAVKRRQGELNREGYTTAHFQGIFSTLKEHFGVPSYHDIARSDFETALKIIAGWYPKKNEPQAQ